MVEVFATLKGFSSVNSSHLVGGVKDLGPRMEELEMILLLGSIYIESDTFVNVKRFVK